MGFVGALLFSIPGILVTVFLFVFLGKLAAISAIIYILLGTIGYKKFKGKMSPVGATIVIAAGLIMVAVGVTVSYFALIYKGVFDEVGMIGIDVFILIMKSPDMAELMPELRKELLTNIVISYLVSGLYFALQLGSMLKEWKNEKAVQKPREIE